MEDVVEEWFVPEPDFTTQAIVINVHGHVHIMRVIERAPIDTLSPVEAAKNGFTLEGETWVRKVTDEVIAAEIARTPSVRGNSGWRRCEEGDIPERGALRDWLRDDGSRLTIDVEKARQDITSQFEKIKRKFDLDYALVASAETTEELTAALARVQRWQ